MFHGNRHIGRDGFAGCASGHIAEKGKKIKSMSDVNLIFNFVGVCVVDWLPAFRFFRDMLGLQAQRDPKHGDWAILGGAWEAYYQQGSRSAIFELFDQGRPVAERHWGLNQGFRPGFHISKLETTVKYLQTRGNISIGPIRTHPWGKTAEFSTIEGIRLALAQIPDTPFSDDPARPYIGHVAIRCADFTAMQHFYGEVLGFTRSAAGPDYAIFEQEGGHPSVILEPGGAASTFDPRHTQWEQDAVRAFPVFISLMAVDIQAAHFYLQERNVIILRDIIADQDWGGTDLHIADPDGNGIQIVQYG